MNRALPPGLGDWASGMCKGCAYLGELVGGVLTAIDMQL